jgi:CRISPR-associated protein Cmr1
MMHSITFTCEVITPMFLAGPDGQTPELRPASIKGAMRFWWRAMHGNLGLDELKKKEAMIFGGAGDNQGRSKVIVRVQCEHFTPSINEFRTTTFPTYDRNKRRIEGKAFQTDPMLYLGYGVVNFINREITVREYIPVGTKFVIKISVYREDLIPEIVKAMKVFEQLGGIGAKSRNGLGCFQITNCTIDDKNQKIESVDFAQFKLSRVLPSFTSLNNNISIFETKKTDFPTWEEAFRELCIAYQHARQNIEKWHQWDSRELIGMPIIVRGERNDLDNFIVRHAKPYFMHVTRQNNRYKGDIYLIPYNYLIENSEVNAKNFEKNKKDYFDTLNKFNQLIGEKMNTLTISELT